MAATAIISGTADAPILALSQGLSFWGGVDPATGRIIDALHPAQGQCLSGRIVMMPTSRGSCSGSGILLDLALAGIAPAALIFREDEGILTLGALVADRLFGHRIPVLRLSPDAHERLAGQGHARITPDHLTAGDLHLPVTPLAATTLTLTSGDRAILAGERGQPARLAMELVCAMATLQGARDLIDVTRVHIDGCILSGEANLRFAEKMAALGARVVVPATMNAISVDRAHWPGQGVPPGFGSRASRLADAYVAMGVAPTYTCAPYHLPDAPERDEVIGWSESNAVLYANSVLGARTAKHPDYLDLMIALTGRAPRTGAYLATGRAARRVIRVDLPAGHDDAFWPLLGHVAGVAAPDCIPLLTGLESARPAPDDLRALCAAFGSTSAAPMLHIAGHTPEADQPPADDADAVTITRADLARAWADLNRGGDRIDLAAFGSPHLSGHEARAIATALAGRRIAAGVALILTLGPDVLRSLRADGTAATLESAGARLISDLCWCSITEPVFPPAARNLITNSGKYAHYAPGLSGRTVRFAGLSACVEAAVTGHAPAGLPGWLH